jgi:hypothetical protein
VTGGALIVNHCEPARPGDGTCGKLAEVSDLAASLNVGGKLLRSQWRAG